MSARLDDPDPDWRPRPMLPTAWRMLLICSRANGAWISHAEIIAGLGEGRHNWSWRGAALLREEHLVACAIDLMAPFETHFELRSELYDEGKKLWGEHAHQWLYAMRITDKGRAALRAKFPHGQENT